MCASFYHHILSFSTDPDRVSRAVEGAVAGAVGAVGGAEVGFQAAFVRNMVNEAIDEVREQIRTDILNMHMDMLKQFQLHQVSLITSIFRVLQDRSMHYTLHY